jgi:hypothetical protein
MTARARLYPAPAGPGYASGMNISRATLTLATVGPRRSGVSAYMAGDLSKTEANHVLHRSLGNVLLEG